ncbi:hypothetical protein M422DRAFT_35545 [Sphaerobolus stellatus SS14]|uniref:Uncharacterized protein n=1 Tax=Sphaerobolus stellatus (strain SS14) TaxID=990650 RepID=A0A0C9UVH2_SPHS4|nr:hypothetical protein M422DRAFT_35545 [Sphaerobolus stellatus SS14]
MKFKLGIHRNSPRSSARGRLATRPCWRVGHSGYNCCRSTTLAARWQDTAPVTPTIAQITLASFLQP